MDVEICKASIMQTCPNCRRIYQDELATCPACYQDRSLERSMPVVDSSKRSLLSAGSNSLNCAISLYEWALSDRLGQYAYASMCGGSVTFNEEASEPPVRLRDLAIPKSSPGGGGSADDHSFNNSSPTPSLSFIHPPVPLGLHASRMNIYDGGGGGGGGGGSRRQQQCDSFFNSKEDLHRIAKSQQLLKMCGWYHRGLSSKGAKKLLMPTQVGTFLLRDSSDSEYLYSLSVQTKCGPSSLRIHYSNGHFRLDFDCDVADLMPRYPCVLRLIESYVESTKNEPLKCSRENLDPAWQKVIGNIHSHITFTKPMYTKDYFPSLKHLCRLCINQNFLDPNVLLPPADVLTYLNEYPYKY